MLLIETFTFNPFEENTYVLYDETKEAVVVDPGCYERAEEQQLSRFIENSKLTIRFVINTHSHIDHVLGLYFVKDKYKVPLLIHKLDDSTLRSAKVVASAYGIEKYQEAFADSFVEEGQMVSFGNQQLKVLFLPGHAPGHVGYYHQQQQLLMGGDVLFHRSIGRTDLPGGNFDTLIKSIHQKLFTLPEEVVIYPGHGPTTTIGEEKVSNPFCALTLN